MNGYLKIYNDIFDSKYFNYLLRPNDKIVLFKLYQKVVNKNYYLYNHGLLIANIKLETLFQGLGMARTTAYRSLCKLDELGVIIKLDRKSRNSRYLVGFQTAGGERLYLINHLISENEKYVNRAVSRKQQLISNKWDVPKIKDLDAYSIDKYYREFIIENVDKPHVLVNKHLKNGKTIYELLFNRTDIYQGDLVNFITKGPLANTKGPNMGS